ncbi:hypothetical protein THO17_20000 [Marinomonas sp. THO17]
MWILRQIIEFTKERKPTMSTDEMAEKLVTEAMVKLITNNIEPLAMVNICFLKAAAGR